MHSKYVFCKASPTLPSLMARKKVNKFHGTCIIMYHLGVIAVWNTIIYKLIDNHLLKVAKTSVSAGNTV